MPSSWGPTEVGCAESDWHGLPARSLFIAQKDSDVAELRRLLADPTQIDTLDNDTFGLLHHIAMRSSASGKRSSAQLIDVLVEAGADINVRNRMAETPLILAAMYGNTDAFERLLHHGARTDRCDSHGTTALARLRGRPSPFSKMTSEERTRLVSLLEATMVRQASTVADGASVMHGLEDNQSLAARLREEGNQAYGRREYATAHRLYSESLEANEDYRTYCNRAACSLKQGVCFVRLKLTTRNTIRLHSPIRVGRWPCFSRSQGASRPCHLMCSGYTTVPCRTRARAPN